MSFRVGLCHVDISWHCPHGKYNLVNIYIKDDYRKRRNIYIKCELEYEKKDLLYTCTAFFHIAIS